MRFFYICLLLSCLELFSVVYAPPTLSIAQVPLTIANPAHPQVLIALTNSQSMDGLLNGAIMVGSGSLASTYNPLQSSTSPVSYAVPSGFTPPIQSADITGNAPYTVYQNSKNIDNGPSRLNVAKASIQAILNTYMSITDFALATYKTSSVSRYTTWVYYMSPTGSNFSFTNVKTSGSRYVINPCALYLAMSNSTVKTNCTSLARRYGTTTLNTSLYMKIEASSDDPNISDVLYSASSGLPGIFVTYNGPSPASPYPPSFSLSNYNNGNISLAYSSTLPNVGPLATGPTNAGYVPASPEVMFSIRGFGYYGNQSATTGRIVVPMTSAGTSPTAASITTAMNTFLPFLQPETDSTTTTEIKASAVQSPIAGLVNTAMSYLTGLSATNSNGCAVKKYLILVSDGLPTQDFSGKLWPPLGSAAAVGYGETATFNTDGSLNATNCEALADAITKINALRDAGILTYVIGLGAGVDSSVNAQAAGTLKAMAVAGGTTDYYSATSPADVVNDLSSILLKIQSLSLSQTSVAVSSTQLQSNTIAYQSSFTPNSSPWGDWTGDLYASSIHPITGLITGAPLWSAVTRLDTVAAGSGWSTNRFIVTINPNLTSVNKGIPFRYSSLNSTQQSILNANSNGQNQLNYLRGDPSKEVRNAGSYRNRSHILGDIVDSQVVYVPPPSDLISTSSYQTFASAKKNRSTMLYVGANDGMLHAFDAATGNEKFAFIPNAVFSNLPNLSNTNYNGSHLFFINSSPQSADLQFADGSWHSLLVGGEGAGGQSIYALDITDPDNITSETEAANKVLWEFTDPDLGLTFSIPQIAQIYTSSTTNTASAVFFGNGYNSTNNHAVFYALNPETGAILKKIDLCTVVSAACDSALVQGLSSVAVANVDGLQNAPITHVYAGDLQGNLWVIDVANANPNAWSARLLFQARDTNNNIQPITTPPVVSLHPNFPRSSGLFVLFGTGQLLTISDLTTTATQTLYGIWDKPSLTSTLTRANLQQQVLTLVSAPTSSLLTSTTNTINWNSKMGWYTDLPIAGQRVVTEPDLLNGTFICVLNTPSGSTCNEPFTSMLVELNYQTGGAFSLPQLDINQSGTIDNRDQYNSENPVGIALGLGFSSDPKILGPNINNNLVKVINRSGGAQVSFINPNNAPRKTGWWQIQ